MGNVVLVRWAIASTNQNHTPSITVFILPNWVNTPYKRLYSHPRVYKIATIPRSNFKFKKANHWEKSGGNIYASNPYWEVNIFAEVSI